MMSALGKPLTGKEALAILASSRDRPIAAIDRPGIIKYYDRERRCVNRGCTSPTHYEFDGVPHCVPHLLSRANETIEVLRACTNPQQVKGIMEALGLEGGD